MIGVILCGGLGTRLKSVVPDLPKALAPINGRPFLEYQIDLLRNSGIGEIVLCCGYRWEAIRAHFGSGKAFSVRLLYSVEPEPLGTAGCVKYAESIIRETALVLNGDTFIALEPRKMKEFHEEAGALMTVAVAPVSNTQDFGSVRMDADGRIRSFTEKQSGAGFVNAGAYLVEPAALRYLAPGKKASMEFDFLPQLIGAGEPVFGHQVKGPFLDIGTPERYRKAQEGWR